ncbi:17854_t:CDS:2 [Acaulospora morrowiae]|uniref:17854_t:CDS:1 n=1 Tax=Acaulospora morrowiae TaxID=94023 RepID=A0A9N8ZRK9_9GLOM|nr:17854_t:CDS:2 [Acaulospora morrowiae]
MLSAYQAANPYSQYDVDQYEKQSVSSSSSSSVSFSNLAVSEKLSNTNRQMDQEEKQKTREKPSKRKSFRRMFGQNEKEEKEEKKVKEKKTISLPLFSKGKTGKNEKNEKHERNENERLRPTPNHSNSGEKRKNRLSYIFFSDEDGKKDDLTPKDDVPQKKRSNSNSSSFTPSENEDGLEKSKNKSNTNRLSKFFSSEEDRKRNLNTNHNNLSDLFIAGNETPIKSHNRSRLINNKNLTELPTNTPRPISLVSSNTMDSDNVDDTYSKENERYQVDNNSISNDFSNYSEDTVFPDDREHENNEKTQVIITSSVIHDDVGHRDGIEVTKENHQDYTEPIDEGIDHRDGPEIVIVDENNQNYSEITSEDKINNVFAGDDRNHQDDEIPIEDTNHENDQDYSVIADENKNNEFASNDQNHRDGEITCRDINHQGDIENDQNDAKTTANRHIETEINVDNSKIIEDNVRQGHTEVPTVDVVHRDYADHVGTKVTGDNVKSINEDENNQNPTHVIPDDNIDTNNHDENEHSTLSTPASSILSDTQSVAINPEFNRKRDYRDEVEERDVRVIEKNRFYEVKKIVEKYQVPKIIEKHVIVTKEDPQARQKIEQLQVTNENLVTVNTQLESKIKEQSQQIEKFSSLESVMVRQTQLVEKMEETIKRLETQVQDQKEELGIKISEHMEDTVRHLESKLNEKSKELDNLRMVMMDQLCTNSNTTFIFKPSTGTIDINGLLPASENPSTDTTAVTAMAMTMTTRQEPQEMYSRNTLVNTLVVKPLVNTLVVSASIATSVLYAVYIRPVIGLVKVVRSGV